jgi:hypothetical protein
MALGLYVLLRSGGVLRVGAEGAARMAGLLAAIASRIRGGSPELAAALLGSLEEAPLSSLEEAALGAPGEAAPEAQASPRPAAIGRAADASLVTAEVGLMLAMGIKEGSSGPNRPPVEEPIANSRKATAENRCLSERTEVSPRKLLDA